MTEEQNWATNEMYRWLSNDEGAYNEIASTPQDMRRVVLRRVSAHMATGMANFTAEDFDDIDWDALAEDFADAPPVAEDDTGPRYMHFCKDCSFLGRHGDDDLYYHETPTGQFILIGRGTGRCIVESPEDIKTLSLALKRAEAMGLYHRPDTETVTKGWAMASSHVAELMELAIVFANPKAIVVRDKNMITATIIQEEEDGEI